MLWRVARCKNLGYGVSPYRFSRRRSPFPFPREEELPIFAVIDLRLLTVRCVTLTLTLLKDKLPYTKAKMEGRGMRESGGRKRVVELKVK